MKSSFENYSYESSEDEDERSNKNEDSVKNPWTNPPKGSASIVNKRILSSSTASQSMLKFKTNQQSLHKSQSALSFLTSSYGLQAKSSCIEITPSEQILFEDIEYGKLYSMAFSVRNISNKANRIRIKSPKTEYFNLNYVSQNRIAAGLDCRGEIEVRIPNNSTLLEYQDYIEISMENMPDIIYLPLVARKPVSDIQFIKMNDNLNPIIDFGYVFPSQSLTKTLYFKNYGKATGTIHFPTHIPYATWEPESIIIYPDQVCSVQLTIKGIKTKGEIKDSYEADISGGLNHKLFFYMFFQILEPLVCLETINNQSLSSGQLDFGPLFYGQQKVIPLQLVNKSHKALKFSVERVDPNNISFDDTVLNKLKGVESSLSTSNNNKGGHGEELLNNTTYGLLDTTLKEIHNLERDMLTLEIPFGEYIIPPFSKTTIHAGFRPQKLKPSKGFSKSFLPEVKKDIESWQDFIIHCQYVANHTVTATSEQNNNDMMNSTGHGNNQTTATVTLSSSSNGKLIPGRTTTSAVNVKNNSHRSTSANKNQTKHVNEEFTFIDNTSMENEPMIKIPLTLCAKVSLPDVQITPTKLEFGKCLVFDRRDILIVLSNKCSNKSITFEFPTNIPQFRIKTPQIKLDPKESLSVPITFMPHETGKFTSIIPVKIMGGIHFINLKVIGECTAIAPEGKKFGQYMVSGVDKLPSDFERELKLTSEYNTSTEMTLPPPPNNTFSSNVKKLLENHEKSSTGKPAAVTATTTKTENFWCNSYTGGSKAAAKPGTVGSNNSDGNGGPAATNDTLLLNSTLMSKTRRKYSFHFRDSIIREAMHSGLKPSQAFIYALPADQEVRANRERDQSSAGGDWRHKHIPSQYFSEESKHEVPLDMSLPFMQRKLNEKKFNEYLTKNYEERKLIQKMDTLTKQLTQRGDWSDPYNEVNLGIDRVLDETDEPKPHLDKNEYFDKIMHGSNYLSNSGIIKFSPTDKQQLKSLHHHSNKL